MATKIKPKTAAKPARKIGVAKKASKPSINPGKPVVGKTSPAKTVKRSTSAKKKISASLVRKTVKAATPAKKAVTTVAAAGNTVSRKKSKPGRPAGLKKKSTRKRTRSSAALKKALPVEKLMSAVPPPSGKVVSFTDVRKDEVKKPVASISKKRSAADQKVKLRKKIKKSEVKVSRLEKKIKKAKNHKEGKKILNNLKEKLVKALKKLSKRKEKAKKLNIK